MGKPLRPAWPPLVGQMADKVHRPKGEPQVLRVNILWRGGALLSGVHDSPTGGCPCQLCGRCAPQGRELPVDRTRARPSGRRAEHCIADHFLAGPGSGRRLDLHSDCGGSWPLMRQVRRRALLAHQWPPSGPDSAVSWFPWWIGRIAPIRLRTPSPR
jgi:hypothetical protein